jgi:hypothetical protein
VSSSGMSEERLLDVYLKMYEHEHRHRDAISANLNQMTGVLALAVGAMLFYIRNLPPHRPDAWHWVFYVRVGGAGVMLVLSAACVARAWWGKYGYFPTLSFVESWRVADQAYTEKHPDQSPGHAAQLQERMITDVAEATSVSRRTNRVRSRRASRGQACAFAAIVLLGTSLAPYTVIQRQVAAEPPKPTTVQGVAPMSDGDQVVSPQSRLGASSQGIEAGGGGQARGSEGGQDAHQQEQRPQMVVETRPQFPGIEQFSQDLRHIETKVISLTQTPGGKKP